MLNRIFPFISWAENYSFDSLKADAVSGLTVALVLIPQSMAYAQLAGLPPYYGLYASFLPPLVAALFGSSRQLATGPVAVVSLLTAASLEPLASAGSHGYIGYVILLTLMVGVFQFLLGLFRLGIVINFLSHPVINGFTNATYLEEQINEHLKAKKELRHIIIFANSINDIDATGEEALSLTIDRIRSAGVDISFARTNRAVLSVLKRTHLLAKIGEDHFYPTIDKAIERVYGLTHNEMEEDSCPLTTVCRIPQRN